MDEHIVQLELLVQEHLQKGTESKNWIDYLKSHGIANYLVALDSTNEQRHKLVYNIERSWYKGRHPLSYAEHQDLNNKHKRMLNDYREKTTHNFDSLRSQQESLDTENLFSEANLNLALEFSQSIFAKSKTCSNDFVCFSQSIVESSVSSLRGVGVVPPCSFAVIALGSVARGEATPYSDLEYAFIVEEDTDSEYFTKLAVDTYFKIGNLGESPLKTFDVDIGRVEVTDCNLPSIGFRIDGISPNAGNIPTGNQNSKVLTFTVEQAMKIYKQEVMLPLGAKTGDLADLLSTSVLIYSFEGGEKLHERFLTERIAYEEETAQLNFFSKRKRLKTLSQDLQRYDFIPEFQFRSNTYTEVKVKPDIFRYPTLLATNLNISLGLNLQHPWDVYRKLHEIGIVSQQDLRYLNIILGLSIYIRTNSYLKLRTKSTHLSLHTPAVDLNTSTDRYYIPKNIFVTLCCLLIPVKQSLISSVYKGHSLTSNLQDDNTTSYLQSIVKDFQVDEHNFMLMAEVLCFMKAHEEAITHICRKSGKDIKSCSCIDFIKIIRSIYVTSRSDPREKKYLKIICFLIFIKNHNERAIDYISWLISYDHRLNTYSRLEDASTRV